MASRDKGFCFTGKNLPKDQILFETDCLSIRKIGGSRDLRLPPSAIDVFPVFAKMHVRETKTFDPSRENRGSALFSFREGYLGPPPLDVYFYASSTHD